MTVSRRMPYLCRLILSLLKLTPKIKINHFRMRVNRARMNQFELSSKSLKRLEGVHPDLVRVVKRAIELSNTDFGVSEGVRTWARQQILLYEGKSTTENSQHLLQDTGYGHAVDVFAYIDGKANWSNIAYGPIVQAFITAAIEEEVQLQFGHLWPNFQDSVHVQLNPAYY